MPGGRTLVNALTDSILTSVKVNNIDQYEPENSICKNTTLASKIAGRVIARLAAGPDNQSNNWTPLHSAANDGDVQAVRARLANDESAGRDELEIHDNSFGFTPLHAAAYADHADVVEVLLEAGAKVDAVDNKGRTPLLAAAFPGHADVVEVLLEAGASVAAVDNKGRTPLHLVAIYEHEALVGTQIWPDEVKTKVLEMLEDRVERVVSALLGNGAKMDAVDKEGRTPLHLAVIANNKEVVRKLLWEDRVENVALKVRDNQGRTPLHDAANGGFFNIAGMLLKSKNEQKDVVDIEGRTPLHLAAMSGHVRVAKELLEKGAIVHAKDNFYRTPIICAVHGMHGDVVNLLAWFEGLAYVRIHNIFYPRSTLEKRVADLKKKVNETSQDIERENTQLQLVKFCNVLTLDTILELLEEEEGHRKELEDDISACFVDRWGFKRSDYAVKASSRYKEKVDCLKGFDEGLSIDIQKILTENDKCFFVRRVSDYIS